MVVLIGGILILVLSNTWGQRAKTVPPKLPDTFKDVFYAGSSGKKTLGTMSGTCWARGGICVEIKHCPSLRIDIGIAGCNFGYKVCCIVQKLGSPVAAFKSRRFNRPVIKDLKDLGASLEAIALRNSMLLSNWQNENENTEDIPLDELMP